MLYIWMRHVVHMNASCCTYECVMPCIWMCSCHTFECTITPECVMSHRFNAHARRTYTTYTHPKSVESHIYNAHTLWMRHVAHIQRTHTLNASCRTYTTHTHLKCVESHVYNAHTLWMRHIAHIHASGRTYKCVMAQISMCSYHAFQCAITPECVMSHRFNTHTRRTYTTHTHPKCVEWHIYNAHTLWMHRIAHIQCVHTLNASNGTYTTHTRSECVMSHMYNAYTP